MSDTFWHIAAYIGTAITLAFYFGQKLSKIETTLHSIGARIEKAETETHEHGESIAVLLERTHHVS